MTHRFSIATGIFAIALGAGCASGAGEVGTNRIAELCNATTNMPDSVCRCVGDKAGTTLNAQSREFLTATLEQKDEATLAELRGKMKLEDLMKAGMFMTTAPAQCAKESATTLPQDPS